MNEGGEEESIIPMITINNSFDLLCQSMRRLLTHNRINYVILARYFDIDYVLTLQTDNHANKDVLLNFDYH